MILLKVFLKQNCKYSYYFSHYSLYSTKKYQRMSEPHTIIPTKDSTSTINTESDSSNTTEAQSSSNTTEAQSETIDATMSDMKVFSTSRPRGLFDGLGKGLGNVAKGVLGGAALMVSAPIAAAYQGGKESGALGAVKGLGVGLGVGIVGGVSLAVGGTATGIYQIGRGVYSAPGSLSARSKGMVWDNDKKEYITYVLQEDVDKFLSLSEEDYVKKLQEEFKSRYPHLSAQLESQVASRSVKDLELYNILEVAPSATAADIKKAYYNAAKKSHPDKHPNDPNAHSNFQKIGEAYQILSDEKLRANYDANGKDGVANVQKLDSSALFSIMFGSEKFEHLIGELSIASQIESMTNNNQNENEGPSFSAELAKFKQRQRAVNLMAKLQPYVDSNGTNVAEFRYSIAEEARELASSPIGKTLLNVIGLSYLEFAQQELSTLDNIAIGMNQVSRGISTRMNIVSAMASAAMKARDVQKSSETLKQKAMKSNKDGEISEEEMQSKLQELMQNQSESTVSGNGDDAILMEAKAFAKKMEEMGSKVFEVMWYITELDIRQTVTKVCKNVIYDRGVGVDDNVRKRRVEALKILGEVFIQCGGSVEEGKKDLKSRLGLSKPADMSGNIPQEDIHNHTDSSSTMQADAKVPDSEGDEQPKSNYNLNNAGTSDGDSWRDLIHENDNIKKSDKKVASNSDNID